MNKINIQLNVLSVDMNGRNKKCTKCGIVKPLLEFQFTQVEGKSIEEINVVYVAIRQEINIIINIQNI